MFIRFDMIHERDRQTDGQTNRQTQNLSATGRLGKSGAPTVYFGTSSLSTKLIDLEN